MNNYGRGLQQYKEQSVNTMTPGEMLILLYDELMKRLKKAAILLDHQDYNTFEHEVQRCTDIVEYLVDCLDRKYEISNELDRLYDFFKYELIRLKAGRNKAIINDLIPLVEDLRTAFFQASHLSRKVEAQR